MDSKVRRLRFGALAAAIPAGLIVLLAGAASSAIGQSATSPADVAAGKDVFAANCAACHGDALEGQAGPALTGPSFIAKFGGANTPNLVKLIHDTMPLGGPKLSDDDYKKVTAFIMAQNNLGGGAQPAAAAAAAASAPPASGPPVPGVTPRPFEPTASANPGAATGSSPTDDELRNIQPADWLTYNRDLPGDRYSPLSQITPANVGKLQVKCIFTLGEVGPFQNSPVIYKGIMYVNGRSKTYALNAKTCEKVWQYDYSLKGVDAAIAAARGVALYDGKVFRGTADGHLIALDAANGKLLWDTTVHDSRVGFAISQAVVAYDGKVYVGESGADKGVKARVWAFDAKTGKPAWAFDVIPSGKQKGAETWDAGFEQGGGSVWSTVAVDVAKNEVLFPIGNPGPDFNGRGRGGINLYTESVIALDIPTGKLSWYVQQIPHDTHDWDTAAAPTLYDRGGKSYMSVAQKNGYIYIYDRKTHKLVAKPAWSPQFIDVDKPFNMDSPTAFCPGAHGAYNGTAYDPANGYLFVGSEYKCTAVQMQEPDYVPGQMYYAGRSSSPSPQVIGYVQAFDAVTGAKIWSYKSPSPINAAVTPTAGGVLFSADTDGHFLAFDQKTGKVLFRFFVGGQAAGGVSSYAVDGQQYVVVTAGNSSRTQASSYGAATLVVFGL